MNRRGECQQGAFAFVGLDVGVYVDVRLDTLARQDKETDAVSHEAAFRHDDLGIERTRGEVVRCLAYSQEGGEGGLVVDEMDDRREDFMWEME